VYEWCWDLWTLFQEEGETDSAPKNRRVMRGAAWGSPPASMRSAYRDYGDPYHKCYADGFRLARNTK